MIRHYARRAALLLLIMALAGCGVLGKSGRGMFGRNSDGSDSRAPSEARDPRMGEVTRLTVNDQIHLRLTDCRLALKLAPEQTAVWEAYENKVVEFISDAERDTGSAGGGNAPEQVERRIAAEQRHTAAMVQLAAYAKTLYAALNDEQRRTADRMLASTLPQGALTVAPAARAAPH